MKKQMKAIIYVRQSSGDEEQSLSVDIQIENCQELAQERGITVVGIYKDLNISGKFYPDMPEVEIFAAQDHALQEWVKSTSVQKMKARTGLGEALSNLSGINYLEKNVIKTMAVPDALKHPVQSSSGMGAV